MKVEELTAKVLEEHQNMDRYQLAIAVAKRCDELENGAPSKLSVTTSSIKSCDLALMEIAENLITVKGFSDKKK
ncbi:MAG TPA: DNA-directed RNA polymerase subunit omega [Sulfurimonas autotrophica]|nr:DNA-directed RNA polymerase subunit omega [Sulfurimonas autotrophica]